MMTNAARMNTNRSKNSRNNRGQQYANNSLVNVSKAASAKKSTINTSEILHQLSSQRKNGSGYAARKSLDSEHGGLPNNGRENVRDNNNARENVKSSHQIVKSNSSVFEIEDYKNLIRNTGQAQTSRNGESSFKILNNIDKFTSEPVICMDGAAMRPTRNQNTKVSKSSNEMQEIKGKSHQRSRQSMIRQPSSGQVEHHNRQKFIQKIQDKDTSKQSNRNSGLLIKSKSNVIETLDNFNINGRDAVVGLDHPSSNRPKQNHHHR
jgi:hypothetical protein